MPARARWAPIFIALLVAACARQPVFDPVAVSADHAKAGGQAEAPVEPDGDVEPDGAGPVAREKASSEAGNDSRRYPGPLEPIVEPARGGFIDAEQARAAPEIPRIRGAQPDRAAGDVSLDFREAALADVIEETLGRTLGVDYTLAPSLDGRVTFSTAGPIRREQVIPALQSILAWHGAILLRQDDGGYQVVPRTNAVAGRLRPRLGAVDPAAGFASRIFPLSHVLPSAMVKLIRPFTKADAVLLTDDRRRLLILAGTPAELERYRRTIATFDVDWMNGMSVAVLPVEHVEPQVVIDELDAVLAPGETDTGGRFRLLPLPRLAAVVVITPTERYLERISKWIDRLDRPGIGQQAWSERGGETGEVRLFTYYVRNAKASELAATLSSVFQGSAGNGSGRSSQGTAEGLRLVSGEGIRITAAEAQNALLISATTSQYRSVRAAIAELDRVPLQVLVRVRIIEVSLSDSLNYGVRWFLEDHGAEFDAAAELGGTGLLGNEAAGLGFAYVVPDGSALIRALAENTSLRVLSAPSLMALNNREARINVGDQIPVVTTQITAGPAGDPDSTTSEVQYRDTGVEFSITPRVNPGGLVFMDIEQNVSDPGPVSGPSGNRQIQQRSIESEIAVQNGQTVILGGLIRTNNSDVSSGVPLLKDIPLIGGLFRRSQDESRRTELIVLITPHVIDGEADVDLLFRDFRERFERLDPLVPGRSG